MTDSAEASAAWIRTPGAYFAGRRPAFETGYVRRSSYVAVRDGTLLAVDVHLPIGASGRLPALVVFTPYYRRFACREGMAAVLDVSPTSAAIRDFFVPHGYVVVVVDVRGTGASFGSRKAFRSPLERDDYFDVAGWIVAQPWSNQVLGAIGVSYSGAAADFLASSAHPAVRATIPSFAVWDTYTDMFYPGGICCTTIPSAYGSKTRALDLDEQAAVFAAHPCFADPAFCGPAPVDEDIDGSLLRQAIAQHYANFDMAQSIHRMECRDSAPLGDPDLTSRTLSPNTYACAIPATVATYAVSGWADGCGYSDGAIRRFRSATGSARLLIGPWDHGAHANVSPQRKSATVRFELFQEYLRFFDHHLKGESTGLELEAPVHYFTMIEERWKAASAWPIPATEYVDLHLGEAGSLSRSVPQEPSCACYRVDFECTTGTDTRFDGIGMKEVTHYYESWHGRDARMLTYTGRSTEQDLEITGHPEAVLWLASSARDGALIVYLEDVAPDGRCSYITEGMLRLIHRAAQATAPANDRTVGPYRTYEQADVAALVPGEIFEVRIRLLPISWLLKAGHRLRVAFAGADADHLARIPAGEIPTLDFHHGGSRRSRIRLPILPDTRPQAGG